MKKMILLLFVGALFSTCALAQTSDIKNDKKVLQNTIKDKKEDKHQAGKDLAHLRVKKALRGRREVRRHRRSIHAQGEHLENHGVKHPVENAKKVVKKEKDLKKGND